MKRSTLLLLILVSFGIIGSVHAAPRRQPPPRSILRQLPQTLNLTDEQRAQLRPVIQSAKQQAQAIRMDPSLTNDERRARIHDVVNQTRSQVNQILTPDQQAKLQQIIDQRRQQMRAQQQPQPPQQPQNF